MTPARPELAAHERTAALQQQADLAQHKSERYAAPTLTGSRHRAKR
jgi:hypothetical protein